MGTSSRSHARMFLSVALFLTVFEIRRMEKEPQNVGEVLVVHLCRHKVDDDMRWMIIKNSSQMPVMGKIKHA